MTSVANWIRSHNKAVTSHRNSHLKRFALEHEFVDRPSGAFTLVADDLASGGRVEDELAHLLPGNANVGELIGMIHDVLKSGLHVAALQEDYLPVAILADQDRLLGVMLDAIGGQLLEQFLAGGAVRLAYGILAVLAAELTEY